MLFKSFAARTGDAMSVTGIVLALANWYARPEAAWAWAAAGAMCVVMLVARRRLNRACQRYAVDASAARNAASVNSAVLVASLMMVIPLAMSLGRSYGFVDDPDSARRVTMSLIGAYLVLLGNAMPTRLPPVSVMKEDSARNQAFQRRAGWTWVLAGLAYSASWLLLPIDLAMPVSIGAMLTAMFICIVFLLRLRKPRPHAPGVH